MQISHTTTTTSASPLEQTFAKPTATTIPFILRAVSPLPGEDASTPRQGPMDSREDPADDGVQRKKSLWNPLGLSLSRSEDAAPYSYHKAKSIRQGKRPMKPPVQSPSTGFLENLKARTKSRKDTLVTDGEDDQVKKESAQDAREEDGHRPDDDYEGDVSSTDSSAAVEDGTSATKSSPASAHSDTIRKWSQSWQNSIPWRTKPSERRRLSNDIDPTGPLDRPTSPTRGCESPIALGKQRAVDLSPKDVFPRRPHSVHPLTPALAKWLDRPGPSNWAAHLSPLSTEPLIDRSTHGDSPYPRPLYKQREDWEKARAEYLTPNYLNRWCYHPGGNCKFEGAAKPKDDDSEQRLRFAATPKRKGWDSGSEKGSGEKSRFSAWLKRRWSKIMAQRRTKGMKGLGKMGELFAKSESEEKRSRDTGGDDGDVNGDGDGDGDGVGRGGATLSDRCVAVAVTQGLDMSRAD